MIRHIQIFYFSGTGNSRSVAIWLQRKLTEDGANVSLNAIADWLKTPERITTTGSDIVLCYPTHGFNAPPIIYHFLNRIPKGNSAVYLINTRAGLLLGKWNIPGLSGIALLWPAVLLRLKGYSIKGMRSVDLPSNWMSIHPAIREKTTGKLLVRWKPKVERIAQKILLQQRTYSGYFSFPIDMLVTPISVLYYAFGRFALSKTFFASASCDACELCVKHCPVGAIKMKSGRPYWTMRCESCMHCMSICPTRAIETPLLWIVVIWSAFFMLISLIVSHSPLITRVWALEGWQGELLRLFIFCILGYPFLWLSYGVLHKLLGIPFVRRFFTLTSLTHLRFWRRYKNPRP